MNHILSSIRAGSALSSRGESPRVEHLHKGTAGDRRGPFSLSHQQSRWSWERVWSFLEPNFSSVRMLHLLTVPPSQTLLSRLPGFWARVVVVVDSLSCGHLLPSQGM